MTWMLAMLGGGCLVLAGMAIAAARIPERILDRLLEVVER
jgi:hypothetical protein